MLVYSFVKFSFVKLCKRNKEIKAQPLVYCILKTLQCRSNGSAGISD